MLKLLADECVNQDVVSGLRQAKINVSTVKEAGLTGATDEAIFKFAVETKRALLSFDRGFGDIFRFDIGKSHGIIVVLVGQMAKAEIVKIILTFLAVVKTAAGLRGKLAILGKTKIRLINR